MNQKKKLSRKVISYVLALLMVFSTLTGIAPGTRLTAHAADNLTLTLNEPTALLTLGEKVVLTAALDNATDQRVKWEVSGANVDAVKLYSDESCQNEVGTDATETLTVYAKGISGGTATVTATSSEDSDKKASCEVTVNTAYINYLVRTATNKIKSDDALMALQVTFNGHKWYIIDDNSTSAMAGSVTLFLAEVSFGESQYYPTKNKVNAYNGSSVRTYLNNIVSGNAGTGNPNFKNVANVILDDTVTGDKMYLLSSVEALKVPKNVRISGVDKYNEGRSSDLCKAFWLRTPGTGSNNNFAMVVLGSPGYIGNLYEHGYDVTYQEIVRPALKLDLSKVGFDATTQTFYPVPVSGVTIKQGENTVTEIALDKGATATLTAVVEPVNATDKTVTWSSNDANVATVDENGIVTAVASGQATITAKATNGTTTTEDDKTSTCTVNVTKEAASDVTVPTLQAVTYDPAQTLNSIALTGGWEWVNKNIVPTVGNTGYAAELEVNDTKYDYSGIDGYDPETHKVTRTIELTVNKATASEVTTPTLQAVTYSPTNTLDNINLTGGWEWVEKNITPTVGNTGYAAELEVNDTNYDYSGIAGYNEETHKVTRIVLLTVNKATAPAVTFPNLEAVTYSPTNTLANINLSGWTWVDNTIVPSVGNTGYDAVMTVDDTNYDYTNVNGYDSQSHTVTRAVPLTVNMANSTPATVTGVTRTYNGNEEALVTVTGNPVGGNMLYVVGTDNTTAPTDGWSDTIPTKKNSGTYYVWYKVSGDANYNATDPSNVEAKINPVDKTNLNSAINEAEQYYNSIKDETNYAEIASTLKTAIDSAKAIAQNDNVTESVVNNAITTINTAKNNAVDKQIILQVMSEVSAKTGSTYTGSSIQLINVPTTNLPTGYTMKYAVTNDNTAPAADNYDTSIPTKDNAGTYHVWYRVENNSGDVCSTVEDFTVSIAQKELTVTWTNYQLTYNGLEQKPTATLVGVVEGDKCTVLVSGEKKNVNSTTTPSYTATASLEGDDAANYVIKTADKTQTFTITPKEISVTWTGDNYPKLYSNSNTYR